jgi:hypothetical protein
MAFVAKFATGLSRIECNGVEDVITVDLGSCLWEMGLMLGCCVGRTKSQSPKEGADLGRSIVSRVKEVKDLLGILEQKVGLCFISMTSSREIPAGVFGDQSRVQRKPGLCGRDSSCGRQVQKCPYR